MDQEKVYRKGVGAIVIKQPGLLFVGQRLDVPTQHAWQFPQGGVEDNEDSDTAVLRELQEETGIKSVQLIAKSPYALTYNLPDNLQSKFWNGKFKGQSQIWYVFQFTGIDTEINLTTHEQEFSIWKWDSFTFIKNHIVPFKKDMYLELEKLFQQWV